MPMQSLKEIGQKLLKLESGNKVLTDGRTLKIFGGYIKHNTPPLFVGSACAVMFSMRRKMESPLVTNIETDYQR